MLRELIDTIYVLTYLSDMAVQYVGEWFHRLEEVSSVPLVDSQQFHLLLLVVSRLLRVWWLYSCVSFYLVLSGLSQVIILIAVTVLLAPWWNISLMLSSTFPLTIIDSGTMVRVRTIRFRKFWGMCGKLEKIAWNKCVFMGCIIPGVTWSIKHLVLSDICSSYNMPVVHKWVAVHICLCGGASIFSVNRILSAGNFCQSSSLMLWGTEAV